MKRIVLILLILGFAAVGVRSFFKNETVRAQVENTITPTIQTPRTSIPNQSTPTPIPPKSPFNITPLPAIHGPRYDITESQPLTVNRDIVQVDDWVILSAQIKNNAAYNKTLQYLCFESSDGNLGCTWNVNLAPGQTYSLQNAASWITGGTKTVWITWSQDGFNYYEPVYSNRVKVNVLD